MTYHVAEFNFGTLRYTWGDPSIAGFEDALGQVNAIAARSPGFVWRMPDDEMEVAQQDPTGPLADGPNTASTLSIWTSAAPLYQFVTKTLHAKIMAGRTAWFVPGDSGFLVCWRVPQGRRPDVTEGVEQWRKLQIAGDSKDIFGAKGLAAAAQAKNRVTD